MRAQELPDSVVGVIREIFEELERLHGEVCGKGWERGRRGCTHWECSRQVFVRRALGYLTLAKHGLSAAQMEDLLSVDDAVLNAVYEVSARVGVGRGGWVGATHACYRLLTFAVVAPAHPAHPAAAVDAALFRPGGVPGGARGQGAERVRVVSQVGLGVVGGVEGWGGGCEGLGLSLFPPTPSSPSVLRRMLASPSRAGSSGKRPRRATSHPTSRRACTARWPTFSEGRGSEARRSSRCPRKRRASTRPRACCLTACSPRAWGLTWAPWCRMRGEVGGGEEWHQGRGRAASP